LSENFGFILKIDSAGAKLRNDVSQSVFGVTWADFNCEYAIRCATGYTQ
jgi:hypothetical protein